MVGGMFPNASNNDPGSCPRPGLVGIERGNLTFFFFFWSSGAGSGENGATFHELSQIPNRTDKR
jgi:hypothetical protein